MPSKESFIFDIDVAFICTGIDQALFIGIQVRWDSVRIVGLQSKQQRVIKDIITLHVLYLRDFERSVFDAIQILVAEKVHCVACAPIKAGQIVAYRFLCTDLWQNLNVTVVVATFVSFLFSRLSRRVENIG